MRINWDKTINEIAMLVRATLGDDDIAVDVSPSQDSRSYRVNTDKALRVLGFRCEYDLASAIRSIRDAFQGGLLQDPLTNPLYYNIKRMKQLELR